MNRFHTAAAVLAAGIFMTQNIDISRASEVQKNASAVTVVVEKALPANAVASRRYVGSVEAISNVNIIPRISGELRKIHFQEGSLVKSGDLLYEIEDTTYKAAVQALKAQLEAQKATLEFATAEYSRKYKLLKSNVVSTATHEQALMEINVAKANIKRLGASLTDAENTLSYTRIHTPISGRIGKSAVSAGNLITPQSGALADVQQLAPIYVKFSISEKVLRRDFGSTGNILKYGSVRVILSDGTLFNEKARVALVDNKVNAKTNTITMWATFSNKNLALLPGSFVTVILSSEAAGTRLPTVLPSALIMGNNHYSVWVLNKNNIPQKRAVKPGDTINGRLIILDGVKIGETVIVDGTHKITGNNAPVNPIPAADVFGARK